MDTSVYLAKLIGPVMLAMGVFVALYRAQLEKIAREILDSAALLFIAGILALCSGLAIVLAHNVWTGGWPVLVTLMGWIALVAGLARIFLPNALKTAGTAMLGNPWMTTAPGILMALIGAYLSYQGYAG